MRITQLLLPVIVLCFANVGWTQHEAIPGLIKQLHSEKKKERLHAVHALGERGPAAVTAVPQLVKLLDEKDADLRHETVMTLGKIRRDSELVVPAVTHVLSAKSSVLRHSAVDCLREFKTEAKSAAPQLKHLLNDPEQVIQIAAARTIVTVAPDDAGLAGDAARVLVKGLDSDDASLSVESVRGLVEIGPKAVPAVVKVLSSQRPATVKHACDTLGAIGSTTATSAEGVIQALIKAGSSSDVEVRQHAIDAMGTIGAHPELVVPALKHDLSDKSAAVRSHAARAIGDFGKDGAPAVSELTLALKDADHDVRSAAAESLGRIGPAAESSIPGLVDVLHDSDSNVSIRAATALGKFGKAAVHSLVEKLGDPNSQLLAATILVEIGPDAAEAVPALTNVIHAKDSETAREALLALGAIGPGAKSASSKVLKILEDSKSPHRAAAAFALGRMKATDAAGALKTLLDMTEDPILQLAGATALLDLDPSEQNLHLALPELSNALTSKQPEIRAQSAMALAKLGPLAKSVVPALRHAMKEDNPSVRTEVMLALAGIGPDSQAAVPEIVSQLHGAPDIREVACHTLGRIGPAAKEAVPALKKLMHSRDHDEQTDGAWALALIAPEPETLKIAIPLVIEVLQSPAPPSVRVDAANGLGKFGEHSPEARKALQAALKDGNESVRHAAELALKNAK